MKLANEFIFVGHNADFSTGKIDFYYLIKFDDSEIDFKETLHFPPVKKKDLQNDLVNLFLDNILLALGLSYWKLYCPKKITLNTLSLTKDQANFWNTVYTKGLGEFFYRNKIDFRNLVKFPYQTKEGNKSIKINLRNKILLGLGGGKDSIVAAELLRKEEKSFDLITIGTSRVQQDVAKVMGEKTIVLNREMDKKLFRLNKQKMVYNGHVPISVIYAFLSSFACVLYDYNQFLVANEKSSSYGNLEYFGQMINHQWSKSEEFELMYCDYLEKHLTPSLTFKSILRNLDEIKTTEIFIELEKYFPYFSSCNANFKITRENNRRWCGKCPKCLFVFVLLSGFISRNKLIKIFSKDLFADEELLPLFKQLLGIEGFKPFECVGTPEEVKTALDKAYLSGEWNKTTLMKFYKHEIS